MRWNCSPNLFTTNIGTINEKIDFTVQIINENELNIQKMEIWHNFDGYWKETQLKSIQLISLNNNLNVYSFNGSFIPSKLGLHEYTFKCTLSDATIIWSNQFQKNGKLFISDSKTLTLQCTDVLMGIDPQWFTPMDVPVDVQIDVPLSDGLLANKSHTHRSKTNLHRQIKLMGHLIFPVDTAYWARIFPIGLINSFSLIRKNVFWLEPNTYLGSDKPTCFFSFQRTDHLTVVLIPLAKEGVCTMLLPQKDASIGVQINLEAGNDGLARIFVVVGDMSPLELCHLAMQSISPSTMTPPENSLLGRSEWYDYLGYVVLLKLNVEKDCARGTCFIKILLTWVFYLQYHI
jgi:hypothetical protein